MKRYSNTVTVIDIHTTVTQSHNHFEVVANKDFGDQPKWSRRGSRGGAKGAAAPPFGFLLIIIHIIHCYTHYFNLQAGVKIVIITILKIITFITKRMHSCKLIANTRMAMAKKK